MREEKLVVYLKNYCYGREKAVRSAELERILGISGTDLRKLINRLRRKGVPIGSGPEGYFYIRTAAEACATIRQLERMVQGLNADIRGLNQALDSFTCEGEASRG
jgi:biotin operon repressor